MPQITCPSGLAGEIRKLKVKEENLLADTRKVRSGKALAETLAGVWLQTTNPGPYKIQDGGSPDWRRVLMGDHFYAMLQMRIATYGSTYVFKTQCVNGFCRAPFEWEIDLNDLPVKNLSAESRDKFLNGNEFSTTLANGDVVRFKLLLADAQERMMKVKAESRDKMVTEALRMQIIEVHATGNRLIRGKVPLSGWIEDLDADVASDLRDAFDDAGCGVETSVEITCPHCDTVGEIELPFGGREFFSRSKRQKEAIQSQEQSSET